jgi:predicted RNA-binding Zn-ribbon protein involved in translation (DUF1610 family)
MLFCRRFPAIQDTYEQRYAVTFGKFRLPLITRAASAFRLCGDWSQGIARIRCPSCGFEGPAESRLCQQDPRLAALGFLIESGTRILDQPTREALCQYIVRASLSLQRIRWDEQQDVVTWSASLSGFFKGRIRRYSSLDFIAQVTLHVPPHGRHLVRRYGLYSSRGRGTWARLLAKVHELDVMACPRCGNRMSVIAVIVDPTQIRKATCSALGIIACLDRHGRGPPPLGRGSTPPQG